MRTQSSSLVVTKYDRPATATKTHTASLARDAYDTMRSQRCLLATAECKRRFEMQKSNLQSLRTERGETINAERNHEANNESHELLCDKRGE